MHDAIVAIDPAYCLNSLALQISLLVKLFTSSVPRQDSICWYRGYHPTTPPLRGLAQEAQKPDIPSQACTNDQRRDRSLIVQRIGGTLGGATDVLITIGEKRLQHRDGPLITQ